MLSPGEVLKEVLQEVLWGVHSGVLGHFAATDPDRTGFFKKCMVGTGCPRRGSVREGVSRPVPLYLSTHLQLRKPFKSIAHQVLVPVILDM